MSGATVESILLEVASLPLAEQERLRSLLLNGDQQKLGPKPPIKLAVAVPEPDLSSAMEWLSLHSEEYAGQWVALDGARLISHSDDHCEVALAAKNDGAYLPLITFIEPKSDHPFVRV